MVRKRQVWLTPVDVDLLITALESWSDRMDNDTGLMNRAQYRAARYTQRRVAEMVDRLSPEIDA